MEEVRKLLLDIKVTHDNIQFAQYQMGVALSKGRRGDWQNHRLRIGYLKRKLKWLADKLSQKLNGVITIAKYRVGDKTYEQIFTNVTQQEAEDLLQMRAILESINIEILEIREIPTKIREV